jgi:hypothetical protein
MSDLSHLSEAICSFNQDLMMTSKHDGQPATEAVTRKISDTAGDFNNPYSRQEKINADPAETEVRQTTEDLKARLRELLVIRFLS